MIQLESAIGGAIRNFKRVRCVAVPRTRFLPVKKMQDMMVVMSDAFVTDAHTIVPRLNPQRSIDRAPIVHLSSCYETVAQFNERFAELPKMLELDTLTITGDVKFGKNIKLKVSGNLQSY